MDSFIAIDYETANSSYESVCAIGISFVEGQEIKSNFYTLIKPEEEFAFFDSFNTSIHGITEKDVKHAPSFRDVWPEIEKLYVSNHIPFACHYAGFDIRVTEAMLYSIGNEFTDIEFYDTINIKFHINNLSDIDYLNNISSIYFIKQ